MGAKRKVAYFRRTWVKVNGEIRFQSIILSTKHEDHQYSTTTWFLGCLINCLLKYVSERKKGRNKEGKKEGREEGRDGRTRKKM